MFFYNTISLLVHFEEAYSRTFKQENQWYFKQKCALLQSSVQGQFSKRVCTQITMYQLLHVQTKLLYIRSAN